MEEEGIKGDVRWSISLGAWGASSLVGDGGIGKVKASSKESEGG